MYTHQEAYEAAVRRYYNRTKGPGAPGWEDLGKGQRDGWRALYDAQGSGGPGDEFVFRPAPNSRHTRERIAQLREAERARQRRRYAMGTAIACMGVLVWIILVIYGLHEGWTW